MKKADTTKRVRCAVYTRKSSEEGLEQEFNSLDAQREAGEAFVASQKNEGWACVPTRYDDGGFTGGNMERPGLRRLLDDIEAGLVDCVVVYKVDRLSRSLMDFARTMEVFDRQGVSFVSVTQQFNTTHSMGRLTLNILLSFAQFEREIISERTRDKIAATRRKGLWSGGRPLLGYDIEHLPGGNRLKVNKSEAERVRAIFEIYLERGSVMETIRELDRRGWKTKRWTSRKGDQQGGNPFDKSRLHGLLTNVAYLGKVRHRDEVYPGQHDQIVDDAIFEQVQASLRGKRSEEGRGASNKYGALLRGLVRCQACGCGMIHHHASDRLKNGAQRRYRYYVCVNAQKRGWSQCPGPSLPAADLESFVIDQLRSLRKDDGMVAEAVERAQVHLRERVAALEAQLVDLERQRSTARRELREIVDAGEERGSGAARAAQLREELREAESAARRLRAVVSATEAKVLDEDELTGALEAFEPTWEALTLPERERLVQLLVREVVYDAASGTISVTFRATEDEACQASR